MKYTLLTIIIPTRNRSIKLKASLENLIGILLRNKVENVEIIVSNNLSSDSTSGVLDELSKKYEYNFRIISQTQSHESAEEHILSLIDIGAGEYTWILSDDEILLESNFISFLNFLGAKSSNDFLILDFMYNSGTSLRYSFFNEHKFLRVPQNYLEHVMSVGMISGLTVLSSIVIRSRLLNKANFENIINRTGPFFSYITFCMKILAKTEGEIYINPVFIHLANDHDRGDYSNWESYAKATNLPVLDPWALNLLRKLEYLRAEQIIDHDFLINCLDLEVNLDSTQSNFPVPLIKRLEYIFNKINLAGEINKNQKYSSEQISEIISITRTFSGTFELLNMIKSQKFLIFYDYTKDSFLQSFICKYLVWDIYKVHDRFIAVRPGFSNGLQTFIYKPDSENKQFFLDLSLDFLKSRLDRLPISTTQDIYMPRYLQDHKLLLSADVIKFIIFIKKLVYNLRLMRIVKYIINLFKKVSR